MAVVEHVGGVAPDSPVASRQSHRVGVGLVLVVVAVVAVTIAAGVWWFRGGTFLRAEGGGGDSGVVLPNEQFSVGIFLTTVSGPSVVLDGVSASIPDGAHVRWSIYRSAGRDGLGSVGGSLEPKWPTTPVRGYRVSQPDGHPYGGLTELVATVVAPHPGVFRLSNITIRYHSARRVRRSAAHTWVCVLVAPPADEKRLIQQELRFRPHFTDLSPVDSLVAQFETCADPTLSS